MKLFNYTFEESQSFVNEDTIKKLNQKGSWKRFIGLPLFSVLVYIIFLSLPLLVQNKTVYDVSYFNWLNWSLIIPLLVLYCIYLVFSFRYRNNRMKLKYVTSCYMWLLLAVGTIGIAIGIVTRRNLTGIACFVSLIMVGYYLYRTVPASFKEAVENKQPFQPLVALMIDKAVDGLVVLGGTGLTAGLVIFDRSTGSDVRGNIDAILMPFVPAISIVVVYYFFIDLLRGYYLFKYSEQYRAQFDYSVEEWYGKKSKEYKKLQVK